MSRRHQLENELSETLNRVSLAPSERDLVRRTLIEALKNGTSCEIEQVMRTPSDLLRRRLRAVTQIERDDAGRIAEISFHLERDGEPVLSWCWQASEFGGDGEGSSDASRAALAEARNALSSIIFSTATIRLATKDAPAGQCVHELCEIIAANSARLLDNISIDRAFAS